MALLVRGVAPFVFTLAVCTAAAAHAAQPPVSSVTGPLAASITDYGRRLLAEPPFEQSAGQPPEPQATVDDAAWTRLASTPHGQAIVVTDRSTKPVTGVLAEVTADEIRLTDLVVRPPAVTRISRADVLEVRTTPHRHTGAHAKRGFWIGAAVGALLGAIGGYDVEDSRMQGAFAFGLVGGLYGAGIGAGVGAIISFYPSPKSDVLYSRIVPE